MNLQTMVDTLKEVRTFRGPDRGGSREDRVARGHGLQGHSLGQFPAQPLLCVTSCCLSFLDGAKRPLLRPLLWC